MRADLARLALLAVLAAAPAAPLAEEPALRVVLRWQAIPGASGYDLQIARDPGFSTRELEVRVERAGHRLKAPSDVRRYWRVRAVDGDGRPGAWSAVKTIEPAAREPEPVAEAAPVLLDVPPLPPAEVAASAPLPAEAREPIRLPSSRAGDRPGAFVLGASDLDLEGPRLGDLLRRGRPAMLVGWRANLLGVTAPSVAVEGTWPLPWLGAPYSAALRACWWRERTAVPVGSGGTATLDATADVLPLTAFLFRSFPSAGARLYAGAGVGVDLVVIRLPTEGALEASAAVEAVAGAGRRLGPGEAFAELGGGFGGVDGPEGRLRTGGISLSVGYRLGR